MTHVNQANSGILGWTSSLNPALGSISTPTNLSTDFVIHSISTANKIVNDTKLDTRQWNIGMHKPNSLFSYILNANFDIQFGTTETVINSRRLGLSGRFSVESQINENWHLDENGLYNEAKIHTHIDIKVNNHKLNYSLQTPFQIAKLTNFPAADQINEENLINNEEYSLATRYFQSILSGNQEQLAGCFSKEIDCEIESRAQGEIPLTAKANKEEAIAAILSPLKEADGSSITKIHAFSLNLIKENGKLILNYQFKLINREGREINYEGLDKLTIKVIDAKPFIKKAKLLEESTISQTTGQWVSSIMSFGYLGIERHSPKITAANTHQSVVDQAATSTTISEEAVIPAGTSGSQVPNTENDPAKGYQNTQLSVLVDDNQNDDQNITNDSTPINSQRATYQPVGITTEEVAEVAQAV